MGEVLRLHGSNCLYFSMALSSIGKSDSLTKISVTPAIRAAEFRIIVLVNKRY